MMFILLFIYILTVLLLLCIPLKRPEIVWEPTVDVIVAARNEESLLPDCLKALANLEYPAEKLCLILVNDASTDATPNLMRRFAEARPNVQVLDLRPGEKQKPGKAGALAAAIALGKGEIICITDADCRPNPRWVRGLLRLFEPQTAVVGGLTILQPTRTVCQAVQALDWLFLLSVAAALSQAGLSISWIGNNFAFRRRIYEEIGGYEALPDTLVEDFTLIRAVSRRNRHLCRFFIAPESIVISRAAETFRELYFQRRRWSTGVREVPLFGFVLMAIVFFAHAALIAAFFFTPWAAAALALKAAVDWLLIRRAQKAAGIAAPLRLFAMFELYYIAYTLFLPPLMMADRQIRWKNERYPAARRIL